MMHRWYATTLSPSARLVCSARRACPVRSVYSARTCTQPYSTARTAAPNTDISSEIYALRKQERLALYQLREHADDFIRHVERILAPARAVPSPESVLKDATSSRQYISTERYTAAAKSIEQGNALIKHARDIQEHCKELEVQPHDDRQMTRLDSFIQDSENNPPDFVALKLEEKARTKDIKDRLKELSRRTAIAKQVTQIASKQGIAKANAYMKRLEGKTVLDPAPPPPDASLAPFRPKASLVSSGWNDLQDHVEEQLESDAKVQKRRRR